MGHSSKMIYHNQHTVKAIAHMQVCQVVKTKCVPRSRWNMQWVKSRIHMWLNLCSSTHDTALTKIFHILANSFPPESVERFSKSFSNSFVTSWRTFVQLYNQSQPKLIVPRDTKAIEAPKIISSSFYPAVFRPLTLVPIKRVLGVPLAETQP
jgi:hypothetical protein